MKKTSKSSEKTPRLSNYVENLKFSTRLAVVNALRKRIDLNKLNKDDNNLYIKTNKITNDLKDFNKDFESNMKIYQEIREENDLFSKKYKIAKGKNISDKNKEFSSTTNFQKTFFDLITTYKEHGYKMTDLSLKNKLFERSPLLIENDKIVRYYLMGDYKDIYRKDLRYTTKLNKLVNERIAKEERIFGLRESEKTSSKIDITNEENKVKTIKDLVKDVKSHEEQLARSKSLVDNEEFKKIYEKKKGESLNSRLELKKNELSHRLIQKKKLTRDLMKKRNKNSPRNTTEIKIPKILRENIPQFVKKQTFKSFKNDESLKSISYKNFNNPSETARMRDLSTINSTMYSKTMKNFTITPSIPLIPILGRNPSLFEYDTQDIIGDDKETIKNNIENAVSSKLREMEELNSVYEKTIGKDDVKKVIIDYFAKTGKDKKMIEENYNKKLEPNDLLRYFSETKNKINNNNILEIHKNFVSRYGPLDLSNNDLSRVKELDGKLSKLDYILVRELNKIHKD